MIDTVIFDMDGLLVDSEPLWVLGMQEVLSTVGVAITPELAMQTTGLRTSEVLDHWFEHFKWAGKTKEQVGAEIIDTVIQKVIASGRTMEGTRYILDKFKNKNFKLGVASSSPERFINIVLEHFKIGGYFDAISSAEFEPFGKPHPAVYLSCAKKLSSKPGECLAFEDSINGMIAAKAARIKTVVVPEAHSRKNPKYTLANLQLDSLLAFNDHHLQRMQNN